MAVKLADASCFQWTKSEISRRPSLASAVYSPASLALRHNYAQRSLFLGTTSSSELYRAKGFSSGVYTGRVDDFFSDEEFSTERFKFSDDSENDSDKPDSDQMDAEEYEIGSDEENPMYSKYRCDEEGCHIWPEDDDNIEMKANSVDIPLSLRIIKKKLVNQQCQEGESAWSSVKKAFSSMVFIIRELHSHTLRLREFLFYEDLREIWERVQKEMNASFVWLFEQVFSRTPTLMVYVMIFLVNFTVHSISANSAVAHGLDNHAGGSEKEISAPYEKMTKLAIITTTAPTSIQKYDPSSNSTKPFPISTAGSTGGGGGKVRTSVNGTDDDGIPDDQRILLPDCVDPLAGDAFRAWNAIVEEAAAMEAELRGDSLDLEAVLNFVSPITAKFEDEDEANHVTELDITEFEYEAVLAHDPYNPLFLANYAQFLYTALNDLDRAEEYFKRAIEAEPKDAEAYNKYAMFLWEAREDLWNAEQAFVEAVETEPENPFYAASYAHFLWNTGGDCTLC